MTKLLSKGISMNSQVKKRPSFVMKNIRFFGFLIVIAFLIKPDNLNMIWRKFLKEY